MRVCVCVMFHLVFFLTCCAILRELHLSSTTSIFSAKTVLFIVVPSWSQCWGSRGWTLWEAAVWCAIRGLKPWSGGEVMHNSHGLNLLYFITLTVWVSHLHLSFLLRNWIEKKMGKRETAHFLFNAKNILTRLFCIWRVCCYYYIPARCLYSYFKVSETWTRYPNRVQIIQYAVRDVFLEVPVLCVKLSSSGYKRSATSSLQETNMSFVTRWNVNCDMTCIATLFSPSCSLIGGTL